MLDYAANGVVYWPAERLRSDFEARAAKEGKEPEDVFRESLGHELDLERFWDDVEQNLLLAALPSVALSGFAAALVGIPPSDGALLARRRSGRPGLAGGGRNWPLFAGHV